MKDAHAKSVEVRQGGWGVFLTMPGPSFAPGIATPWGMWGLRVVAPSATALRAGPATASPTPASPARGVLSLSPQRPPAACAGHEGAHGAARQQPRPAHPSPGLSQAARRRGTWRWAAAGVLAPVHVRMGLAEELIDATITDFSQTAQALCAV